MGEPSESWDVLEHTWQGEEAETRPEPAEDLHALHARLLRRVRRQSLLMTAYAALEGLVMLAFLGFVVAVLRGKPGPFEILTASAVITFVALAMAFSIRNRRGVWRSHAATTREFLELSLERCRRRLQACRFAVALTLAEGVFFLLWIPWAVKRRGSASAADYLEAYAFLAALLVVWLAVAAILLRQTRRQQAELEALRASLST